MLNSMLKKCLASLRWLVGAQLILSEQKRHERSLLYGQRKLLFTLGNSLQYASEELESVRNTIAYKRTAEVVRLLAPMDVQDGTYVRVGRSYDGGYVMLDDFKRIDAAYSFGIADDVSWDESIANRGIDVFMYDHSIQCLPKTNPRFHYFKVGISGCAKDNAIGLKTLEQLIAENGHTQCCNLILKMDVEGYEWDVFTQCSQNVLAQFSQIVVEFHDLVTAFDGDRHRKVVAALTKLNQTHQSVHVHANGHEIPLWISGLVVPPLLEVTYVRRADSPDRLVPNTRQFPTELDQCSAPGWPDIHLGYFNG
jgi:hypothetical protein